MLTLAAIILSVMAAAVMLALLFEYGATRRDRGYRSVEAAAATPHGDGEQRTRGLRRAGDRRRVPDRRRAG